MPDKLDKHIHQLDLNSDHVAHCLVPDCGLELEQAEWTERYGADLFGRPPVLSQGAHT